MIKEDVLNILLPKANSIIGKPVPSAIIKIESEIPENADLEYYKRHAELLVDTLLNTLPQAMIEPIIIKLLESKVSIYQGLTKTINKDALR